MAGLSHAGNRPVAYPAGWQIELRFCVRGMHGDGYSRNPRVSAGVGMNVAGIPRGWILLRREPRIEPFTFNALTRIYTYESVMYAFNFCLVS